jgi:23S rRNA (guanosine2251-2'-O)-methyltransferase
MNRSGRKRSERQRSDTPGRVIIYGWHSAVAALNNPRRHIHRVLAMPNALARLSELEIGGLPQPAELRDIERAAGAGAVHQGIVIIADPLPETDLADLEEAKLVIVLDQLTDPHNVGAILRSAAAFGAEAIILAERNSPAESGVLAKAASGGLEHVPLVRVKNLARAMDQLGAMGFLRLGLDSSHAELIEAARQGEKVAVALGAEGAGLRRLTREKCDRLVRIETPGPIKSLNVSNAAALALFVLTGPSARSLPTDPALTRSQP